MKKITLLLVFLMYFAESKAQAVSGYLFSESTETYAPVSGTNSLAIGDDGMDNGIPIGFNYTFGGISYNTFSISTNGWIRLGADIPGNSWVNFLSNTSTNSPDIAPFWDDHNRTTGSIQYALSGVAPSRILEIGWDNITIGNGGVTNPTNFASFKMRLYEANNQIDFVYSPTMNLGGGLSASIGLNDLTSFLSVTPGTTATVSNVTATDNINATANIVGKKYTFIPQPQCLGTPMPGNTLSSSNSVCANVSFTLSFETTPVTYGNTFQWQFSTNGTDYSDIAGATSPTLLTSQTEATYYQCLVTCSGSSAASTPFQVLQNSISQCYCLPTYDNGKTDGDLISNVVISGTTLSNNTGTAPINPYYTYFTGQPNYTATLQSGYSYSITVSVGTYGEQSESVWIDYNDDTVFSADEKVGYSINPIPGNGSGTFTLNLACDAPLGTHRMRVRDVWNTDSFSMDPCANYGYGEVEDYDVTIVAATICQPPIGFTTGSINSNGVELTWEIGCGQTSWEVFATPAGSPAPSASSVPTTVSSTNTEFISGLLPNTSYDFYLRSNCMVFGYSDWEGPITVSTLPIAVANDDCVNAIALTPGTNFAQHAIVATNVGATKTIGEPNPTCGVFNFGGDVWFSVVVPADGNITIETQADAGSAVSDTALSAYSGTCGNLTTLGCNDDIGPTSFSQLILTGLTPGATIYARVWEYANDTFGTFQVSAYNATLKTNSFDTTSFEYYPNPVKDILNLSYNQEISEVNVFNLIGQEVFSKRIGGNQAKLDLSLLSNGAYLVKVTSKNQTKTIKIIKQ